MYEDLLGSITGTTKISKKSFSKTFFFLKELSKGYWGLATPVTLRLVTDENGGHCGRRYIVQEVLSTM